MFRINVSAILLCLLLAGAGESNAQSDDVVPAQDSMNCNAAGDSNVTVVCDQRCIYRLNAFKTECKGIDEKNGATLWRKQEACVPDGPYQCSPCYDSLRQSYYSYLKNGHVVSWGRSVKTPEACEANRRQDPLCK